MSKNNLFKHISIHEVPEKSPGFLLWHSSTLWRSSIEAMLKSVNLTHPQFVVLATTAWLTKNGEYVTQVAIGKMAGLDPNTLSQIMRSLEKKELIKRIKASDVRAKNPVLTDQGLQLLNKALPIVETADTQFFKALTTQELEVIRGLFQKLTFVGF